MKKHGYEIKTKAEVQEIVDAGIITLNNFMADETLGGETPVQGAITLE